MKIFLSDFFLLRLLALSAVLTAPLSLSSPFLKSRVLCLSNGERIPLSNNTTIFFEVTLLQDSASI